MTPETGTVLRVKDLYYEDQTLRNDDLCVVVESNQRHWGFQALRSGFALTLSSWPHTNFEEVTDGA